jgi:hypothetical protein
VLVQSLMVGELRSGSTGPCVVDQDHANWFQQGSLTANAAGMKDVMSNLSALTCRDLLSSSAAWAAPIIKLWSLRRPLVSIVMGLVSIERRSPPTGWTTGTGEVKRDSSSSGGESGSRASLMTCRLCRPLAGDHRQRAEPKPGSSGRIPCKLGGFRGAPQTEAAA